MKFKAKKLIISLLFINYLLASSCPNMCSGHGSCGKGGVCSCFPGWIDGTCPYGHSFVDPTTKPADPLADRASLECSGQGSCDRTSGSCKCFGGYEGVSCDRMSCPNNCNGHGVCTAVKMIDLNEDSHIGSYYENDMSKIGSGTSNKYNGWDADQSYVCVCDGEYTGFDCSEKKCPTGYVENSDCDSPSKSTQTITITQDQTPPSHTAKDCMAYLEYTDQYNRIWYSDAFCVTCQNKGDKGDGVSGITDGAKCGEAVANGGSAGLILGWEDAIYSLPVGVIDVSSVEVKYDNNVVTASINFGNQQTGKQNPIRIIAAKNLDTSSSGKAPGAEWCGSCGSGYHGMTTDQLKMGVTNDGVAGTPAKLVPGSTAAPTDGSLYSPLVPNVDGPVQADVDGIPPLECSRNGLCDRSSGLCKCFEGYYGIACTEQASML